MCFLGVLAGRQPKSDMGPDSNNRGAGICFRFLNSQIDRFHIIAIRDGLYMPVISSEARHPVFGEGDFRIAIDRDMVVIIQVNQLPQTEMTCQRSRFGGDTLPLNLHRSR